MAIVAILALAAVDLLTADRDTLANVATSNRRAGILAAAHVGRAKPWSAKVMQRARAVLIALGWQIVRHTGRKLSAEEQWEAHAAHGRRQNMAASTRDWVIPSHIRKKEVAGEIVHQPSPRPHHPRYVEKSSSKRASARRTAGMNPRGCGSREHVTPQPRPIELQRFAARLAQRLPRLDRGHIGHLQLAIERIGVDVHTWTADDLVDAIDNTAAAIGIQPVHDQIRDPIAHFITTARRAVRLAIAAGWKTRAVRRAEQEARFADTRRYLDQQRQAAVDPDPEATAAARAEYFRQFPRRATPPRRRFAPPPAGTTL